MHSLIDAHCHLDFPAFDSDRAEVIARANIHGIRQIVIPGVKRDRWERISELCDSNTQLFACYGLHPYFANEHSDDDLLQLSAWLGKHDYVAVGECGLDYRKQQADRQRQLLFFEAQLEIAHHHNKPIVIHSVHATADVINAIKNYPGLRGMVHSYSGSYEQARTLIDLGFYISLGGAITYDRAGKIRSTAAKIPLSSILLETDAPDQPDVEHHRQRNEPAYLVNILECLSELRDEPIEEIAAQTTANARALFQI
jgi:TatD DNase family protein